MKIPETVFFLGGGGRGPPNLKKNRPIHVFTKHHQATSHTIIPKALDLDLSAIFRQTLHSFVPLKCWGFLLGFGEG